MKVFIKASLVVFSLLGIFLFILSRIFDDGFSSLKVQGRSMLPTYQSEEGITCRHFKNEKLKRKTIVVFNHTGSEDGKNYRTRYVKRIIAIPNDEILFVNGLVFLNGKQLSEPYAITPTNLWEGGFAKENQTIRVPQNQYFVMGDNRMHSSDSREFGFVSQREISCYINQISKKKADLIQSYENQVKADNVNFFQSNCLTSYKRKVDKQVNINDVLMQSYKAKLMESLLENKYKATIKQDDLGLLTDKINRQIIFLQILINKWIVDKPLDDANDFQTWELIVNLKNETCAILSTYSF